MAISVLLADVELEYIAIIREKINTPEVKLAGFAVSLSGLIAKCIEYNPNIVVIGSSLIDQDEKKLVDDVINRFSEIKWVIISNNNAISHKNILFCTPRIEITDFRNNIDNFISTMLSEYEAALDPQVKLEPPTPANKNDLLTRLKAISNRDRPILLVLGASTGGPTALNILLSKLPKDFELPIVICQHVPPNFSENLIETLQRGVEIKIVEGQRGLELEAGIAIVAPGGSHMVVKRNPQGKLYVDLHDKEPVQNCKPSVDVLFSSIANNVHAKVIAAILTGMGSDGVEGLKQLKKLDAHTIAEAKETCVVFGMPMEAIKVGIIDSILPIHKIADEIITILDCYTQR